MSQRTGTDLHLLVSWNHTIENDARRPTFDFVNHLERMSFPFIRSVFFLFVINCGGDRDVAKVFNRWESSNDRRVFGPKTHSSMLYLGVRGHAAQGNFENAYSRRCIFLDLGGGGQNQVHSGQTFVFCWVNCNARTTCTNSSGMKLDLGSDQNQQ